MDYYSRESALFFQFMQWVPVKAAFSNKNTQKNTKAFSEDLMDNLIFVGFAVFLDDIIGQIYILLI